MAARRASKAPQKESGASETARETRAPRLSSVVVRRFLANRLAVIGLILSVTLITLAVIGPFIAPYNPIEQHENGLTEIGAPLPPNAEFLFGHRSIGPRCGRAG